MEVKADSVLDIGGGAKPVKDRVKSWDVQKYEILDNSAENMATVIDYEYDINFEIPYKEKQKIGHYDMVFCLEVFEYVFDPIVALGNISYFMKDGSGHAWVTFPTLYPLHNPEGIDYLRYQRDSIEQLAEQCCLHVEEVIPRMPTKEGVETLGRFYSGEGFHARKYTSDIYALGYIVRFRK
jgi:hypothetical protein